MPLKSKIDVSVDAAQFEKSFEGFKKYQEAVKALPEQWKQYSHQIQQARRSGEELTSFLRERASATNEAAKGHGLLAGAAERTGTVFRRLSADMKHTAKNLESIASSFFKFSLLTGIASGLLGFGFGVHLLDNSALRVMERRREALGLGARYGALRSFGVNFSRFGIGSDVVGAVSTGAYDYTSPQYRAIFASGVRSGETSRTTVEILRRLPQMFQGVQPGMIGPRAESLGLTNIMSLQQIVAYLSASDDERQQQLDAYERDSRAMDMPPDILEKWANFTTTMDRAGTKIETILQNKLSILAPELTKLSKGAEDFISVALDSRTAGWAIKGVASSLEWFAKEVGSDEAKQAGEKFLSGLEKLSDWIVRYGSMAFRVGKAGAELLNGNKEGVFNALGGQEQKEVPPGKFGGHGPRIWPSIRYHTWKGPGTFPDIMDDNTGKMIPHPTFKFSGKDLSWMSTYPRKGEKLDSVQGFVFHHTASRGTPDSVIQTLNRRHLGVQYVMDRDGSIYEALPDGTRGAHILPSEINNLSNANTEGMEIIAKDDKDITPEQVASAKKFARAFSRGHPGVHYFGHGELNPSHKEADEGRTVTDAVRRDMLRNLNIKRRGRTSHLIAADAVGVRDESHVIIKKETGSASVTVNKIPF